MLARPVFLGTEEYSSKPFIGISCYPEDATDTLELMRRATLVALRAARTEGAAVNFFDPEHDREALQRMVMERSLRSALEQGDELLPFFQPKISARTGELLGAEVLLRWQHPVQGLVSPAQFIPLAEETGLIHPISEWLIECVCQMLAEWQKTMADLGCISINLSANSFFDRTLVQFVDEVLARTGVAPSQLVIELTESVLMQDTDAANRVIASLRQRGIRISLDDFGTGFSSLGYLNRFDIDEIKIDRSFVLDLESDPTAQALVQAVISLGHALGLEVVAEGVETEAQATLLRQMGCDIFQGFLFARPMPGDQFFAYCSSGKQGVR
jgi:EAL domain-containing protein (putative c-di-GMP-specific phosphodiesterase class I)